VEVSANVILVLRDSGKSDVKEICLRGRSFDRCWDENMLEAISDIEEMGNDRNENGKRRRDEVMPH
jgi:hypothetical protein